jgi:hypothetical protein
LMDDCTVRVSEIWPEADCADTGADRRTEATNRSHQRIVPFVVIASEAQNSTALDRPSFSICWDTCTETS